VELIHTVFEPKGAGPHPTIVALHGWGASALDLLALAPYVCEGRFLFLCPQGNVETPIGPGAIGYGWFPLRLDGPPNIPAFLAARKAVESFVDSAVHRYPIDQKKLVVLGFSQGGALAYSLGLSRPERFTALVALSTRLPDELLERHAPAGDVSGPAILVQHGSRDELIDVNRAREAVEKLRGLGMPITYREYDMGHEINARSLNDLSAWLAEKVLFPIG
jgi:phospholipase/carboxylesterase